MGMVVAMVKYQITLLSQGESSKSFTELRELCFQFFSQQAFPWVLGLKLERLVPLVVSL